MNRIFLILTASLLVSCQTLKYDFREKVSDSQTISRLVKDIAEKSISESFQIKGLFTRKNSTYRFRVSINTDVEKIELSVFDLSGSILLLDAHYNSSFVRINSINSISLPYHEADVLIKILNYAFSNKQDDCRYYYTRDDFLVVVDKKKNYYKYNSKKFLIKKENLETSVIYNYKDNVLCSLEVTNSTRKYVFLVE